MTMTGTATRLAAPDVKTPWQREKEARDLRMSEEYDRLLAEAPGRSRMELNSYLMRKYGFASGSAYYAAVERGRKLREGGAS